MLNGSNEKCLSLITPLIKSGRAGSWAVIWESQCSGHGASSFLNIFSFLSNSQEKRTSQWLGFLLIFHRIPVQFAAATSGGSRPALNSASVDPYCFLAFTGTCTHRYIPTCKHTCAHGGAHVSMCTLTHTELKIK